MVKRTIALIATGGTIDSVGTDRLDLAWYSRTEKRLEPGEQLARVPEISNLGVVTAVPSPRYQSHALRSEDLVRLAVLVKDTLSEGADAVVITHGTDTLEETAYFLSLVLRPGGPVVLVGAMRPPTGISSDADANLLAAFRVAAHPDSAGRGVLVVMNDEILSARNATKAATYSLAAFRGRDVGPIGFLAPDGTLAYWTPQRPSPVWFEVNENLSLPRVDVVLSHVDADGTAIKAFVSAGAKGIVSAGTGAGHPTPREGEALLAAIENGVVVCQSTRVPAGQVLRSSEMEVQGIVASRDLPPWKARILLSLALTVTESPTQIQGYFDQVE